MKPAPDAASRARTVGAVAAALAVILAWTLRAYTPDDAYISFSFAQRAAAGDGWVASAGTPPVEGFSNPLWVSLLAGAASVGWDLVRAAKGMGLASGAALVWVLAVLADRARSGGSRVVFLGPFLLATWPPFALWTASGMENPVYGLCLVCGVLGVVREVWDERPSVRSGWWWVAAMWTRPEAFGLAAVAAVWRVSVWRRDRRRALIWCVIVGGGFAALFLWRQATFGEWLPNTYYAKRSNLLTGRGGAYLLRGAWEAGYGVIALVAAAPALLRLVGRGHRLWHPVWFLTMVAGAHAVFVWKVDGDWMHQFRFLTPMAPFVAVLAADGIGGLAAALDTRRNVLRLAPLCVVVAAWCAAWPAAWHAVRHTRSVDILNETWRPYRETLHQVAAAVGPGRTLVIPELGYPSYATDLRVLDPLGLASAHVAHLRYERVDRLMRDVWRPDVVKPHSLVRGALGLNTDRWFRDSYLLLGGPPDWRTAPEAVDGWYVRRDLFERPAADLPPARATFGGALELRNAWCSPAAANPGDRVSVHVQWLPTGGAGDWRYDLLIRTPSGKVIRSSRAPLHGWRTTAEWRTGVGIEDRIDIELDSAMRPGVYQVGLALRGARDEALVPSTLPDGRPIASGPVALVAFEVVTALPQDRLQRALTEAQTLMAEGNLEAAWDALAVVRANEGDSNEGAQVVEECAVRIAEKAFATAWDAMQPKPEHDLRSAWRAIDRARGLDFAGCNAKRDEFVRRSLEAANDSGNSGRPTWDNVMFAGLALHTDPACREAERLHREMWRDLVNRERAARDRAAVLWSHASDAQRLLEGDAADTPHILRDEPGTVKFEPPLPVDALMRLQIEFEAHATEHPILQLLTFGTAGYRVATIPLDGLGSSLTLEWSVEDLWVMVAIRAEGHDVQRYRLASLAPNPWGAPFYPPQAPALVAFGVYADTGTARTTPVHVTRARVDVAESTTKHGSAAPLASADPRVPALNELRAYERLQPLPN